MHTTALKFTGRKGFTLIELMVAIGVTALLVSLMLTITLNVMGGWNKSSGSLTSGNQARLVLDMIARDMQGAVIKKDGNVWFAATIQQTQSGTGDAGVVGANWDPISPKPSVALFATTAAQTDDSVSLLTQSLVVPFSDATTLPSIEKYRFGKGGVWLRFMTSITDTNTAVGTDTHLSAPRAVAYQIVRLPVVSGSTEFRYLLFRSEVSSSNTFSSGFDLFSTAYDTASSAPVLVTDPSIIRRPEISASPNRGLVVANNIVDFGVRIFTRDSSGLLSPTPNFPTSTYTGFAATSDVNKASNLLAKTSILHDFPAVVEVFVRVLTDEGVTKLENLESGLIGTAAVSTNASDAWWTIVLANSKVFTRRIDLNSNGL